MRRVKIYLPPSWQAGSKKMDINQGLWGLFNPAKDVLYQPAKWVFFNPAKGSFFQPAKRICLIR